MKIVKLAPESELFELYSHKIIIDYTDLIAAATSQTLTPLFKTGTTGVFGNLTGNQHAILRSGWRLITPFVTASITAMTVTFGDVGNTARFFAGSATDAVPALASNTKNNGISNTAYAYVGNDGVTNTKLQSVWTATGANFGNGTVTSGTAGKFEIYFKLVDLAALARPI